MLPERISVRVRKSSLDLPEHRQMGACLRAWSAWLREAADLLHRKQLGDDELRRGAASWEKRCRRLSRRINAAVKLF
jgi:hypothetical protein